MQITWAGSIIRRSSLSVAALLMAAVAGACGGTGVKELGSAGSLPTTTVPTTTTVTPTTTPAPTTTAPTVATPITRAAPTTTAPTVVRRAPAPPAFVATTEDGRLFHVTAERMTEASLGDLRAPRIALTPDGKAVYLELWDQSHRTSLQRWSLAGPPAPAGDRFAPDGGFPAVSPDGRKLAYSKGHPFAQFLVVRDIATGQERTWTWDEGHELQFLSWAPDNRRLSIEDSRAGESGTVIFDTSRPEGAVGELTPIGGPYHEATFRNRYGTLLAVQTEPGAAGPETIVEVEGSTEDPSGPLSGVGAVRRELIVLDTAVSAIDTDASGDHLLIVMQNGVLYQWSDGVHRLVERSGGILDADW